MTDQRPARQTDAPGTRRLALILAAVLLGLAAYLRLRHLGYSDYQGDEARAMLMAARLVEDRDLTALLMHKKGPAEILVPALVMALGSVDPQWARLPFAVLSLGAAAGITALAWRAWGPVAGLIAGSVVALDGYLIAFARIVQYQSWVLAAMVGAVALVFPQGAGWRKARWAAAGALLGLGTWGHYEAIFGLAPVIWLAVGRPGTDSEADDDGLPDGDSPRAGQGRREDWIRALTATHLVVASFAIVAGIFYFPFVTHPQFAETWTYIAERRVGGGLLYNNLADFFVRASFYNATAYVAGLGLALVGAVMVGLWRLGRVGKTVAAVWALTLVSLAAWPGAWQLALGSTGPGSDGVEGQPMISLAIFAFAPVLALVALTPRLPWRWRAAVIWFAGPFLAAGFLVGKPHTHFYTMIPGAALMVAWGGSRLPIGSALSRAGRSVSSPPLGLALAVAGAVAALALLVVHQHVVFVRHTPEYKRVWPEARLAWEWKPFDELPRGGYFGFPYRAGWEAVRTWFASGELAGDYDSNEELLITGWYTLGAPRCGDEPRYYLLSWRPQDEEDVDEAAVRRDYHLWGVVRVNGQEKLWVYDREPVTGPVRRVDVRELARGAPQDVAVAGPLELPLPERRLDAGVGPASLVGADFSLSAQSLSAQSPSAQSPSAQSPSTQSPRALGVTLIWRLPPTVGPVNPGDLLSRNASAFVHLVGPDGVVAQSDAWPDCGRAPTSTWEPGQTVYDPHVLRLPADLPPGEYQAIAGLFDAETGRRWPVPGRDDDTVPIMTLQIGPGAP